MAVEYVTGSKDPVETGASTTFGDTPTKVIIVEGPMELLDGLDLDDIKEYVKGDYEYDTHRIVPTGDGFGKIEITCKDFGTDSTGSTPTRTTWRIQMACVQKDLKLHPTCAGSRNYIEMWLATDPLKRFDDSENPQCVDGEGNVHTISEDGAIKFINAYMAGIETYNEYYPVLQKISYYKRLPGVSMSGKSTTTGNVDEFSDEIGKWDTPGVTLSGYANTGWFKSGDSYEQDNSLVWTRTQEWTWSPNGSNDNKTGWIYQSSSSSSNS